VNVTIHKNNFPKLVKTENIQQIFVAMVRGLDPHSEYVFDTMLNLVLMLAF